MINTSAAIERVKVLKSLGLDGEVAKLFGLSSQDFSQRKRRDTLVPVLVNWALNEGVNINWLLAGEGEPYMTGGSSPHIREKEDQEGEYDFVPFARAELSAGGGAEPDERLGRRFAFRRDWLRKAGVNAKSAYLMLVRGDSMSPCLEEGDTVLVDTARKRPHTGRIYAVDTGDSLLVVKRLELRGKEVRIISDNQAFYPPYTVPLNDGFRVIGRVVWFARQLASQEEIGNGKVE